MPADQTILAKKITTIASARLATLKLRLPAVDKARLLHILGLSEFAFSALVHTPELIRAISVGGEPPENWSLALQRRWYSLQIIDTQLRSAGSIDAALALTSSTAEILLDKAQKSATEELTARFGQPRGAGNQVMPLVIIGMGKLGGGELNFSSDIDLIASYADAGQTDGGKSIDHQDYFSRLVQLISQRLSEVSDDGFPFRVDWRLRPFGASGQLACSFAAMEQYYQREGRDWERYAWIKARPISAAQADGLSLIESLRPFVYRRYLDYAAFEGLRDMKLALDAQVRRKGNTDNLKLGPGGIREIEFIVQLQQLIRGGREPALRLCGTLPALHQLREMGILREREAVDLRDAYRFLRRSENLIQMLQDEQSHTLPTAITQKECVAHFMGYASVDEFLAQLHDHRRRVARHFHNVIELTPDGKNRVQLTAVTHDVWQRVQQSDSGDFADSWTRQLHSLATSAAVTNLSREARSRVDRLMPLLIGESTAQEIALPNKLLLLRFVQSVLGRTSYLALLCERPPLLTLLVRLFGQSKWIAEQIISAPILLDDLLDNRRLQMSLKPKALREQWVAESTALNTSVAADDEVRVERLREFALSIGLRVAIRFLDKRLSALEASRTLADLADLVLQECLVLARGQMRAAHGDFAERTSEFCVLGYGSLGGYEMNFASDLDLVFLYVADDNANESDGPRPLDPQRYFARLAQKLIHLLTFSTPLGPLHAIDTRLRPNGNKGLLVTTLTAFAAYQKAEAWLWEQQALVRARVIAGEPRLTARVRAMRKKILCMPRDAAMVRTQVARMRERLREERDRSIETAFDLKQGSGGIVDLEFALQSKILQYPNNQKATPTDTHSLIRMQPNNWANRLAKAHLALLDFSLRCTLNLQPRVLPIQQIPKQSRATIKAFYKQQIGD
jgi:[glutamine synthetase] adenylyltransferase / [glutamine synthetase]-adenylyl-L-tyrosine phosphorylase